METEGTEDTEEKEAAGEEEEEEKPKRRGRAGARKSELDAIFRFIIKYMFGYWFTKVRSNSESF